MKKYAHHIHQDERGQSFLKFSRKDRIGCLLYSLADSKKVESYRPIPIEEAFTQGARVETYVRMEVMISADFVNKVLRNEHIYKLNFFLDQILKDEFFVRVKMSVKYLGYKGVSQGIKEFLDDYDLSEDELSFASLHRFYYRQKEKTNRHTKSA